MLKLTTTQQVSLTVSAVDAANNPALLEDIAVVSSDTSVVTVEMTDGVFTLAATGNLGTSQIEVTADAKIGSEVLILTGLETIEVVAGEAVALALTFGEPAEK